MVKKYDDLQQIIVPNLFRCPISLDLMNSPVSLSTGVTYDRSSIQHWFDCGNNTCPATMQVLQIKDLVPNHTVRRLIQIWSDSLRPPKRTAHKNTPLQNDQLLRLIKSVSSSISEDKDSLFLFESLSLIASAAHGSADKLQFIVGCDGFVVALVEILVDDVFSKNIELVKQVVSILDLIVSECADKIGMIKLMLKVGRDCLSPIYRVLQRGSSDSKIACLRILEFIAVDAESKKLQITDKDLRVLVPELLLQIRAPDDTHPEEVIEAVLNFLITICTTKRIRFQIVRLGAVGFLTSFLRESNKSAEKALKLLEMISTIREGRSEICRDAKCVSAVLGKVRNTSSAVTEHAVAILWTVCYIFMDPKAQEAVARNNGLTKMLLLMQSNCSPEVRHMACDLLKMFRVESKSCISTYETMTTHIMPY